MNFYTLISKKTKQSKQWIIYTLMSVLILSLFIITINFVVDPYNVTKYNILNIQYKFARDDRTEKVNYFKTLEKFDNIMIGSSRVYSINPSKVSDILGGTTYNFGVGTATVEDHLGIIKYLERENKLPKNIILGVDFYTFNPDIPLNSYFLKNKELNFLSYKNYDENYLSKLYSIDAFRASFKTLKNHFKNKNKRSRFDSLGWAGAYENYAKRDIKSEAIYTKKEVNEEIVKIYSSFKYSNLDNNRIKYYEEIKQICKEYDIKLYVFNTPLNPMLLKKLYNNKNTRLAIKKFIDYLESFENFTNLYYDKILYQDIRNFVGATHMSTNAGDFILKIILDKNKSIKETP